MAASGDVTIAQDGGPAKLHPYLIALVRWCVSCVWSTATVLLHRMMIKPIPQIAGRQPGNKLSKPRPAGREHLHPEPKVECVVLHQPDVHNLDVVFVHGLYGSLCNTWRQGEWRSKYQSSPEKVHLRRPAASPRPCACLNCDQNTIKNVNNTSESSFSINDSSSKEEKSNFNGKTSVVYYSEKNNKYMFEENKCDAEYDSNVNNIGYGNKFHKETSMVHNYNNHNAFKNIDETFYTDFTKILPKDDVFITEKFYNNSLLDQVEIIENYETQAQFVSDLFKNCDNRCDPNGKRDENIKSNSDYEQNRQFSNYRDNCMCADKTCEIGCGCNCDACYSPCWPKDWIKVDYPDARVISINYTSDPHLWRPLWVKESKRLCLHERAEQMTEQLLDLGVGQRPVIWVGHSKGGLFIKEIYCEAYEAYLKTHLDAQETNDSSVKQGFEDNNNGSITENTKISNEKNNNEKIDRNEQNINGFEYNAYNEPSIKKRNMNLDRIIHHEMDENNKTNKDQPQFFNTEETLKRQASLWYNSGAFMFYSVPHRGSPLADIKIPIAARSIELMEIAKDNSLVLSLQERWLRAMSLSKPLVRSLVETRRTLMSVLWLRIVSTDSADPGIGALCGVSVDHREICKPSSRHCLLYTELAALINAALNRFTPITSA